MTLEAFIEGALRRCAERSFVPDEFLTLRAQLGLVPTIAHFVEGGERKCGFLRVLELGLVDWSLEAAVTRYPDRFSSRTVDYAHARLKGLERFDVSEGKFMLADPTKFDAGTELARGYLQFAVDLMRRAREPQISAEDQEVLFELAWVLYLAAAKLLRANDAPSTKPRPRPASH